MKRVEISDDDYSILEWLGGDNWMVCEGDKPVPVKKVLHQLINQEYKTANPTEYDNIQKRED